MVNQKFLEVHIWAGGWCRNGGTPEAQAGWLVQEQLLAGPGEPVMHLQGGRVPEGQPQTDSIATYLALIDALRLAKNENMPYIEFVIHTNSTLVLDHLPKEWQVEDRLLRRLWAEAAQLLAESNNVRLVEEPRDKVAAVLDCEAEFPKDMTENRR